MKLLLLLIFLTIPSHFFSQRVQLASIPGQDSDMDINDMLQQIIAPYHDEITNLNNLRRDKEIELVLWQDFKTNVDNFDSVNRYIFGYESAFKVLTNENSDPSSLKVLVGRSAKKGDYTINIEQLAQAHSIASAPISVDRTIPASTFKVLVNEKELVIPFRGGNIITLHEAMQEILSNDINIKLLNASDTTKVLSLTGKKEGIDQEITFDGDMAALLDIQLLTMGQKTETLFPWIEDKIDGVTNIIITNKSVDITTNYFIEPNTTFAFSATVVDWSPPVTEPSQTDKIALSNLTTSSLGAVTNNSIILPGATPILEDLVSIEETNTVEPPKRMFTLFFDDDSKEEIELKTDKFNFSLEEFAGKSIVQVHAEAEGAILDISDMTLVTSPEGALRPYKETKKAQDSKFLLDGLEIQRPNNTITNLIAGVTLDLTKDSKTDISIKITPDLTLVKDTILQWALSYNNIMEDIFTFTTIPIEKIGKIKPLHEREEDGDDLKEGTFYGNSSLTGFKDRLRRMVSSPHGIDQNSLSLLDQVGIYIRRQRAFNSDPDALRKGTLTVDVAELEKKLSSDFDAISKLFAVDTDGNLVNDKGVSVAAIDVNKMMIGSEGYLTRLDQDSDRRMDELNEKITKKEEEIDRVTRKERQDLLQMTQAISESKALSESLQQRFKY